MFDFFFSTDSQDRSIFDTRIQLNLFYKTPCYLRSFFMISEVRIIRINVNVLLITISTIRFLFSTPLLCFLRFSTPISKHPPTREFNLPSTYFIKILPQTVPNHVQLWQLNSLANYSKRKKEEKKKRKNPSTVITKTLPKRRQIPSTLCRWARTIGARV